MRKLLCIILSSLLFSPVFAQIRTESLPIKVSQAKAIKLGETVTIRDLKHSESPFGLKKKNFKRNRQAPKNFIGRRSQSKAILKELEHQGADRLRQKAQRNDIVVEPFVNMDGLGDDISPMDPTGDVGRNYYIQAVNFTDVGIYDKSGNLIEEFALADLWAPLGAFSAGDPIVLYDEAENRWFLTEFTDPANLLIAVSSSSDPMGSYFVYSFSTPIFPDYPKYGIWPEALMVTTNEGGNGELHQYFLDKSQLIAGDPVVNIQRIEIEGNENTEAGFFVSTPVDVDGQLPPSDRRPIALKLDDSSWGNTTQDEIDLFQFDIDWNDANNTTVELTSIPLSPFDSYPCSSIDSFGIDFDCIPQGAGRGLDAVPEIIMNLPKLRKFESHESLVLSFVTDVTDGENLSGIRWVELRKSDSTDWGLYQEGTYSPDSLDRFMPSVAMDKLGNIALGYSVSSPGTFPGIRFTGRLASDSLGQMTVSEFPVVEGLGPINSEGRFGDYSHMSVDPLNGLTFWFTTEYAGNGTFRTETRIVAFNLARDTLDLEVTAILSPESSDELGAEDSVTIEVENQGLKALSNFDLGFFLDGQLIDTISIADTLLPDSVLIFTFPTTVDLSEERRSYTFKAFLFHPQDANTLNDTLTKEILHLSSLDARLVLESVDNTCSPINSLDVTLFNEGIDTLLSGAFEIQLNEVIIDTLSWEGSIPFGESEDISLPIQELSADTNRFVITFIQANDDTEGFLENNVDTNLVLILPNQEEFTLNLLTDEFPTETTWEIRNEMDSLLAEGGPYFEAETLLQIPICLPDSGCFTFTIFDFEDDGICCGFGGGNYNLQGPEGDTLFFSTGEFSDEESQDFCAESVSKPDTCTLTASAMVSTDSVNEVASILIEVEGGEAPYMYSLDGGETFQEAPLFEEITSGEYIYVVKDSTEECMFRDTIVVNIVTSIESLESRGITFDVFPNPNSGYFTLEFSGEGIRKPSLIFEVLDSKGARIQKRLMSSYDGVFKAPISLVAYPSGTYFIRIEGERSVVKRVIKK